MTEKDKSMQVKGQAMTWLEYKHNVLNRVSDVIRKETLAEEMCKKGGVTIEELNRAKLMLDSRTTEQEREMVWEKENSLKS